jgi:ribonucleoside-diphosphate reductase alpha chain/ribonucleoside-triphosphate reductase
MVKVLKRTGQITDFDQGKIANAIKMAMAETKNSVDEALAASLSYMIQEELESMTSPISVEDIQDIVEKHLMDSPRKDAAKRFILYRYERDKTRDTRTKRVDGRILSDDFISRYKHKPNPMKQLGSFVFYRTYSRWLPDEKRREYWWETVRRAVEYNSSLVPTTKREAEKLFDNIFNLRQFLSGRTFWVGGTDVAANYPMANYNCAFTVVDKFDKYKDIF